MGIELHNDLIEKNHNLWKRKPILRTVYTDLYRTMDQYRSQAAGKTVELGSGMGSIHKINPECIRTDLFPYPWIDQVENAYRLTFAARLRSKPFCESVYGLEDGCCKTDRRVGVRRIRRIFGPATLSDGELPPR